MVARPGSGSGWRRRRLSLGSWFLIASAALTVLGLLILALRSIEPSADINETTDLGIQEEEEGEEEKAKVVNDSKGGGGCATVEEMGEMFGRGSGEESLRARQMIHSHFRLNGAPTVRALPPEHFCRHGFVLGKASEAGFGNEMYKILTAAAISVMLNRSLIIGQTRHIGGNILLGITFCIRIFPLPWRKSSICGG